MELKCEAEGSYSIADDKFRFIASTEFKLDTPIYGGWTITQKYKDPVPWISTQEDELVSWSDDNRTMVYKNLFWDVDLETGILQVSRGTIA